MSTTEKKGESKQKVREGEEFLITKGTPFGEFQINISEKEKKEPEKTQERKA